MPDTPDEADIKFQATTEEFHRGRAFLKEAVAFLGLSGPEGDDSRVQFAYRMALVAIYERVARIARMDEGSPTDATN